MKNFFRCSFLAFQYVANRHIVVILLLVFILLTLLFYFESLVNYLPDSDTRIGFLFFLMSSVLAVCLAIFIPLLIDLTHFTDIALKLSTYVGTYKRIDIGQDGMSDENLIGIRKGNNNLLIELSLDNRLAINVDAEYWKPDEEDSSAEKVFGTILFDFDRLVVGRGSYRYEKKDDAGHYEISVIFDGERTLLLVRYQRLFPDPHLADKVKGWEIWERIA